MVPGRVGPGTIRGLLRRTPPPSHATPTSINLERKNDYSLTFEKAGYSPGHFQIQHHMRGGILALDILFTGLLGIIPDAATGAWNGLSPEAATVTLTKIAMIDGPQEIRVGVRVGKTDGHDAAAIDATAPGVTVKVEPFTASRTGRKLSRRADNGG